MAWNDKHENEVRYEEPDLQAAYAHFKDLSVYYGVQIARKYKCPDTSPIQDAWNTYLKLKKKHGYFG